MTISNREQQVLLRTDLPGIPLFRTGKVRDVYDLGEHFLVVTTDRVSAFDVVLPNGIPDKGRVLTQMSAFDIGLLLESWTRPDMEPPEASTKSTLVVVWPEVTTTASAVSQSALSL